MSVVRFIIADQSALGRGGHYFEYTSCIAKAARAQGMVVHILCNHRLSAEVMQDLPFPAYPVYSHTWGEVENFGMPAHGPGNMVYETLMGLQHLDAGSRDHLLLHTIGLVELQAWVTWLLDCPLYRLAALPQLHLLLRFDPEPLEREKDAPWLRVWRKRVPLLAPYLHFCADTDRLAERYQALLGVAFDSVPIPFDVTALRMALRRTPKRRGKAPVRVLYLGDARIEKGFTLFPDLLAALWEGYLKPGRLEFVFQANTNIPGGEANIMAAIRNLCQYPPAMVRVLHQAQSPSEYFAELAACDMVLIPYSARRYHSRSSGILIEAMAAGKPVLTTAGSWMATQVDPSHAGLLGQSDSLAEGVLALLARLPEARQQAQKLAAGKQAWADPSHFLARLLQFPRVQPSLGQTSEILYIMDGDSMVLCNGAAQVALRQLNYLFEAGYRVRGLFISSHYARTDDEAAAWALQLGRSLSDFPFVAVHTVHANPTGLRHSYLQQQSRDGQYSICRELRLAQAMLLPADLLAALRQRMPDLVFLNYITMYPLLEALGVDKVPVVCETHDIQSFQKAIYGHRLLSNDDLAQELAYLGRCDYLISLNDIETVWLQQKLPKTPVQTLYMSFGLRTPPATLHKLGSVTELLAACEPVDPALQAPAAPTGFSSGQMMLQTWENVDLLFVSSSHQSNVAGLTWFLHEVFTPYLMPLGVTLMVAGSIREAQVWPSLPGVFFCGRVQHLDLLYAAARLCILPITEGAGSPIKTIEALAYGKPLLATGLALRGLPPTLAAVVRHADRPESMAQQIKGLLRSASARLEYARSLLEAMAELANPVHYQRAMDQIFKRAADLKRPRRSRTPMSSVRDVPAEWNAKERISKQLVRAWLAPPSIWNRMPPRQTLGKLLPRDLQRSIVAALAQPADWILRQPGKGMEALAFLGGLKQIERERSASCLQTRLVLSPLADNTLIVQIKSVGPINLPPDLQVSWRGQELSLPVPQAHGTGLSYHIGLPLDRGFAALQIETLGLHLPPRNNAWQLEQVFVQEEFALPSLATAFGLSTAFHEIEQSGEGRPFAWMSAPEVWFGLPVWRGLPKLLMLDAHSLRGQGADQIEIFDGNQWRKMRAREGHSVCMAEIPVLPEQPLPALFGLRCAEFGRAIGDDERRIGIGLHGFKVIGAI